MSVSPDHDVAPTAAARSRAATRERLRRAGLELFAEQGLHGVTSHRIAQRAGVAAGTFYLHFKDKRELCRELAREATAQLSERLRAATAGIDDEAARIRAHAAALVDFAHERRELIALLFGGDAEAASVGADVLDTLAGHIVRVRTERGRIPAGSDVAVLSQAVVGMYARVVAWWAEDPRRATREQLIETLTRIQLSGTRSG